MKNEQIVMYAIVLFVLAALAFFAINSFLKSAVLTPRGAEEIRDSIKQERVFNN